MRETSREPLSTSSGTPGITAEGDDAVARLEELGAVRDELVEVREEATEEIP
jgi:hypothetical protein